MMQTIIGLCIAVGFIGLAVYISKQGKCPKCKGEMLFDGYSNLVCEDCEYSEKL